MSSTKIIWLEIIGWLFPIIVFIYGTPLIEVIAPAIVLIADLIIKHSDKKHKISLNILLAFAIFMILVGLIDMY